MGEGLRILRGSAAGHFLISANKIYAFRRYFNRAEMGGFEPPRRLPVYYISSVARSTTLPHLLKKHIVSYTMFRIMARYISKIGIYIFFAP